MTSVNAHRLTDREMCVPGFQKFDEITGEKTQTYIRGKRLLAMQDEDGEWKPKGLVKYSRDTMPYVTYPGIWERR